MMPNYTYDVAFTQKIAALGSLAYVYSFWIENNTFLHQIEVLWLESKFIAS